MNDKAAPTETAPKPARETPTIPGTGWSGRLGNLVVRGLVGLIAPVAAFVFAVLVCSLALRVSGYNPVAVFKEMYKYGTCLHTSISVGNVCQAQQAIALTVNDAVPLYLSAVAVAIGFQMTLFNIGVEGQYLLAALMAAEVGGQLSGIPGPLANAIMLLVAMVTGGLWAAIAGVLKVTRGVSEVISTIMLNYIAIGVSSFLFSRYFTVPNAGNNQHTATLPGNARFPNFFPASQNPLYGMLVVAGVIGLIYWFILGRTRFGFDLKASGLNPFAAAASGVNARSMVVTTMVLSGVVAGLVGLPYTLSHEYSYDGTLPAGIGFTGIAVALLGRNNPFGIAIGALLFGFLDSSANVLDIENIPKSIVAIMQGVIVLSVVVAYEAVRRVRVAQAERSVSRRVADDRVSEDSTEGVTA